MPGLLFTNDLKAHSKDTEGLQTNQPMKSPSEKQGSRDEGLYSQALHCPPGMTMLLSPSPPNTRLALRVGRWHQQPLHFMGSQPL